MLDPILKATLTLTESCNLTCAYCFTHGKTEQVMSFKAGKKCIDFLFTNACEADPISLRGRPREVQAQFWGGEPLLEWNLMKEVVFYAERRSKRQEIPVKFGGTTNGTLITEEKLRFMKDHQVHFVVSFDGTPESHNQYRKFRTGVGSHSIVARNIESTLKFFPGLAVRMSPYAEGIHRFFEDTAYIIGLGVRKIIFSPVYESNWTEASWQTFEAQCDRIVDLLSFYKQKEVAVDVEHYRSYAKGDDQNHPCGAGRFYVGFGVDGAIYPCHRFDKFQDRRHWAKKEVCIGHVDYGITNPYFRRQFIDFKPTRCAGCEFSKITPCHGGCYAVNYDLTGDIRTPPENLCEYTRRQSRISKSYCEKCWPQGFPEATGIRAKEPQPEGIMAVIRQFEKKVEIAEQIIRMERSWDDTKM